MTDLHIDDFYRDTAKILLTLYKSFPRQITLYVEDIAGPDTPDEFGLHSKRHEACLSALLWLSNAGYLHYSDIIKREALENVTLSHRAFVLLNSSLNNEQLDGKSISDLDSTTHQASSIKPVASSKSLLIHQLKETLKYGSSDTLASLIKRLMILSRALPQ